MSVARCTDETGDRSDESCFKIQHSYYAVCPTTNKCRNTIVWSNDHFNLHSTHSVLSFERLLVGNARASAGSKTHLFARSKTHIFGNRGVLRARPTPPRPAPWYAAQPKTDAPSNRRKLYLTPVRKGSTASPRPTPRYVPKTQSPHTPTPPSHGRAVRPP